MANQQSRLPSEQEPRETDSSQQGHHKALPPHAGRTSGAGARAERPSEGRKTLRSPGRGGKAPSAAGDDSRPGRLIHAAARTLERRHPAREAIA